MKVFFGIVVWLGIGHGYWFATEYYAGGGGFVALFTLGCAIYSALLAVVSFPSLSEQLTARDAELSGKENSRGAAILLVASSLAFAIFCPTDFQGPLTIPYLGYSNPSVPAALFFIVTIGLIRLKNSKVNLVLLFVPAYLFTSLGMILQYYPSFLE